MFDEDALKSKKETPDSIQSRIMNQLNSGDRSIRAVNRHLEEENQN